MLDVSGKPEIFRRIRLVIVDRQPIVLLGLKSILGAQRDFEVVASSSDGTSCLAAIRDLSPDIALIADTLPDLTASQILAIAKAEKLFTRLVFFTEPATDHDLAAAIAAGACHAISKYASADAMLRSLRLMTKHSRSPDLHDLLSAGQEADGGGRPEKMLERLTDRERQIVRLVSEGMSNKEIARRLNVTQGTVKVHLHNIFQKLEITNRTVLATLALLQRPSGFGMLALAFLAFAIADELKASEASGVIPDDIGTGHAGEHDAGYVPWKRAILRHLVVSEFGEAPPDNFARLVQVGNPAAALEALRAAEQSAGSNPWKDHGPVGSSTPDIPAPLLRGLGGAQVGGDPIPDHQFPRFASNPISVPGGYANFAALAGALIYALQDSQAAAQPHDPGKALIDSFVVVTGENAATAATTNTDARHADESDSDSQDYRLPSAIVTAGHEGAAGEGARSQASHGAESDTLQKSVGLVDAGHDAGIGENGPDQPAGGNVDQNVAHRAPLDSAFTSSPSAFDFAPGSSRISLAAFGALAWLQMTSASQSIPPHTLAWIYNAASNETIVYVNPTDRSLDVGDHGLLEIHLQGIVSVAELDVAGQREGAVVAVTLEKLEEAVISAISMDETAQGTDNDHAGIGASGNALATAGGWNIAAYDGLKFQFEQIRAGVGEATRFKTFTSDPADAAEDGVSAFEVPAHASSTVLARSATVAVENVASKSPSLNPDTGGLPTGLNQNVDPGVATADSTGHGNSQHSSEKGADKAADTDSTEAGSGQGNNGVGKGDEHRAAAADDAKASAADKTEQDNSGHSNSANAADNADPDAATAVSHGNSQHASEKGADKAADTDSTEDGSGQGNNGVGKGAEHGVAAADDAKASAADKTEHGNSGHSNSANAADNADPGDATAASASHGNSQHASEKGADTESAEAGSGQGNNGIGKGAEHQAPASAAIASEDTQPAKATPETGVADNEPVFRFDSEATPPASVAMVELKGPSHPLDLPPPGQQKDLETIAQMVPPGLDQPSDAHGNSASHHAAASAHHDLLI
jgi:DNA-binding NarL/FixJ family response regulator